MKKHLIIGLAVATIGYLCMQDALLVQDTAGEVEKVDPREDKDFRRAVQKEYTWNRGTGTEDFRNASDIPLPFTDKEKTNWDNAVNRINNEIKTLEEKIKKIREETAEERDRLWEEGWALAKEMRKKVKEFIEKQAAPLKQEIDETRKKFFSLMQKPFEMLDNIDPEATNEERSLLRRKIFDFLTKELFPIDKKITELLHQRDILEYDFKSTDEYKKIFDKKFELAIKTNKVMSEETALRKVFKEAYKVTLSYLYDIFKPVRAKEPDKKLVFPDEAKIRMIEEEEIIKETMEKDPLTEKKAPPRTRRRRR